MAQTTVYSKVVPYQFHVSVTDPARRQAAADALTAMATFINAKAIAELAPIFTLIDSVMFFEQDITSGPWLMNRSFTDLPSRQFNLQLTEFLDPNHRDCSRATYYFHDAYHVRQFIDAGSYPPDSPGQAQWEVDAIKRQIGAADLLGCDYLDSFLGDFDHSYGQILARLSDGVATVGCARPNGAPPTAMA